MPDPKPPAHLTAAASTWWATVAGSYSLESHHLLTLTTAAEAWDRMHQARELLALEGVTYRNRFGDPCKHPAVSIEEAARVAFLRALRELDLDGEPQPDPRQRRR